MERKQTVKRASRSMAWLFPGMSAMLVALAAGKGGPGKVPAAMDSWQFPAPESLRAVFRH